MNVADCCSEWYSNACAETAGDESGVCIQMLDDKGTAYGIASVLQFFSLRSHSVCVFSWLSSRLRCDMHACETVAFGVVGLTLDLLP